MAFSVIYSSDKCLTFQQIKKCLKLVQSSSSVEEEFWRTEQHTATFIKRSALPDLAKRTGVQFDDMYVHGAVVPDDTWLQKWGAVLKTGEPMVAEAGRLMLFLCYHEKQSNYKKSETNVGDSIGIRLESGRLFLSYFGNGSKVCTDHAYGRQVIKDIIRRFDLPLRMREAKGHYFLKHTSAGEIRITSAGLEDGDPSGFDCEVRGIRPADLLEPIQSFLEEYASRLVSSYWSASPDQSDHIPEIAAALYGKLRRSTPPAKSYNIDLQFHLSSLDGIKQISSVLAGKDEVKIALCTFAIPDRKLLCGLEVISTASGNCLKVYSRNKAGKKSFLSSPLGKALADYL